MSLLKEIVKEAGQVFTKNVKTLEEDGQGGEKMVIRRRVRPSVKLMGWGIMIFLILWHFIFHPVLAHHCPDISFPQIDDLFGWLTAILMGL